MTRASHSTKPPSSAGEDGGSRPKASRGDQLAGEVLEIVGPTGRGASLRVDAGRARSRGKRRPPGAGSGAPRVGSWEAVAQHTPRSLRARTASGPARGAEARCLGSVTAPAVGTPRHQGGSLTRGRASPPTFHSSCASGRPRRFRLPGVRRASGVSPASDCWRRWAWRWRRIPCAPVVGRLIWPSRRRHRGRPREGSRSPRSSAQPACRSPTPHHPANWEMMASGGNLVGDRVLTKDSSHEISPSTSPSCWPARRRIKTAISRGGPRVARWAASGHPVGDGDARSGSPAGPGQPDRATPGQPARDSRGRVGSAADRGGGGGGDRGARRPDLAPRAEIWWTRCWPVCARWGLSAHPHGPRNTFGSSTRAVVTARHRAQKIGDDPDDPLRPANETLRTPTAPHRHGPAARVAEAGRIAASRGAGCRGRAVGLRKLGSRTGRQQSELVGTPHADRARGRWREDTAYGVARRWLRSGSPRRWTATTTESPLIGGRPRARPGGRVRLIEEHRATTQYIRVTERWWAA